MTKLRARINTWVNLFEPGHSKILFKAETKQKFIALTHSQFSPYEMVIKEKPQVPIEFHLKHIPDQNSNYSSSFCTYLPTQSHKTLKDQNKIVQRTLSKPFLTCTLQIKQSSYYIYFCQLKKDFCLNLNHRFDKTYKLEKVTLGLHQKFEANLKSYRKLQPLEKSSNEIIGSITEVN